MTLKAVSLVFLVLIFFKPNCFGQSRKVLCDGGSEYIELAKFLKSQGEYVDYDNNEFTCISILKLSGEDNVGPGLYTLRSSEIHGLTYLFAEYENGRKAFVKDYTWSSYSKVTSKLLIKTCKSSDFCETLKNLDDIWCRILDERKALNRK